MRFIGENYITVVIRINFLVKSTENIIIFLQKLYYFQITVNKLVAITTNSRARMLKFSENALLYLRNKS